MNTGTPPPIVGDADAVAWMRWAEQRIGSLATGATNLGILAGSASRKADMATTIVGDINLGVDVIGEQASVSASTDRVPAPMTHKLYWNRVTLGQDNMLTAINASATDMGVLLTPNAPDGAVLTLTAANPMPATRKFYVFVESSISPIVYVDWLNPDGTIVETVQVGASRIQAPEGPTHYRFYFALDADDNPQMIYKANVFEIIGSGDANSVELGPDSFQVKDGDGNVVVDMTPDIPKLIAPSTPQLATAVGTVTAGWDGKDSLGVAFGPSFSHVITEWAMTDDAVTWTPLAVPLSARGNSLIRAGIIGQPVWVRFRAVDRLGRVGDPSTAASIIVEGITLVDVDAEITDAINQAVADAAIAKTTADGKNRIFVRVEPPSPVDDAPLAAGDQWWVMDENGDLTGVSVWNEITGLWTDYRLVANEIIVPGSVGSTVIADGSILTDKLAANSIDATKIQALSILTEHVVAGAITVSHLQAGIGGLIDISANASINFVVGMAEDNASEIARIGTVYRLTPDGAEISKPDSPFALTIQNTGISILENGTVVSYWNAGQMFVPSLVATEVVMAHHKVERFFTGPGTDIPSGTVVRSAY